MRTLLSQIYETGEMHHNAITQKRGLFNAFEARGSCMDFDYLANDKATLLDGFINRIDYHQPDLIFTQFHSGDQYIRDIVQTLRAKYPGIRFVNWSGDSWAWSLTSEPILELARMYDLWLCAAPDVLSVYAANGIKGHFWQIAFEEPVLPLPDVPEYDIVFLGNIISEKRRELRKFLRTLPYKVGIYGDGDDTDGHCTYDFAMQRALYRKAKIAIADAAHVDQKRYVSDRPLTIMASGGAILLHEHVDGIGELIEGIEEWKHYLEWNNFTQLGELISQCLEDIEYLPDMASGARDFVYANHTWECRVQQLERLLGEL